jgi:hypothetical protein
MAVISIFFATFVGGLLGAASGAFRSGIFGLASNVNVSMQGLGEIASVGAVLGFITGAAVAFVVSSTLAGVVFMFAQIERNTRSLLQPEMDHLQQPTQYRAAPRF